MRALVIISLAVVLGACRPPTPETSNPAPIATRTNGAKVAYGVYKYCDTGRAVYVMNEVKAAAIAIVDNAPECEETK